MTANTDIGGREPPAEALSDHDDLASFGYRQELHRSLGNFSFFAAGFSYISIMTGMFQLFYFGFGAGGPAFFWTWPMVFVGQVAVCLCFTELAHYPLAGSVYQWSKQVGTAFVSYYLLTRRRRIGVLEEHRYTQN